MHFTKMQGLGNDYLYVYGEPKSPESLSIKLSDRHFGPGSDGMIWISPSSLADFRMRIFNADGSEAKMCGNGIRCVGKYVYEKGYTDKTKLTVETLSGVKNLELQVAYGKVRSVTVEMGLSAVSPEKTLSVLGGEVRITPVDMGNPHGVIFTEDAEKAPLEPLGKAIDHHEAVPGGVNVEFVQALDRSRLRMRVWERGSGVTLACGTGACASTAAAAARGLVTYGEPVSVVLDGGTLTVTVSPDGRVKMSGSAEFVYEGDTELC